MFYISQVGTRDCAFTCLKMMLANYHHDRNYLYLKGEDRPYSFYELVNIGRTYQMELIGMKIENHNELFKARSFPIVVTLNQKKGIRHSVLLLKVNRKYAYIYDPNRGKMKMSSEAFFSIWTGRALSVANYTKTKCPIYFTDFISKKDKVSLPLLQVLGSSSLLVGTYFLSEKTMYYLPIIFFSLFVIFEILFRKNLVDAMRRMDEQIYNYQIDKGEKSYLEIYQTIEKYRYLALSTVPSIIYSLLISAFIAVILVLNSYLNLIYVILPIGLAIVDTFIYKPFFHSQSEELASKESEIDEATNDDQFKMKSEEIHAKAYKLGLNKNVYTYIEIALLLTSIVATMMLSGVFQTTYVIFYLCISIFLKQNFAKILEVGNQSEELGHIKAKLFAHLDFQK